MNSYTLHINLYDVAFIGAIFTGLSFAVLLWFTKTVNRSANRFLAFALAVMVFWMIRVLAIDINLETYLPHWDWLPMQFLLTLGPLMYFYVRKITHPQHKFSLKDLLHLCPLLLEQVVLALEINESAKTNVATYLSKTFQQFNPVLQLLIFISNITYLQLCNRLIQKFYHQLQPVLMDRPLLEFRWLRRLLVATAALWVLWIVCAAVSYFSYNNQYSLQVYYPFYIFFVVIIIWTAMAALLKPQAAVTALTTSSATALVPAELRAKGILLKRAMETNLYYQDPDLSLTSLAEKFNMSSKELSRVINTVLNKNFNDFVNEYRVKEAARKIQDSANDNITLLGIGFEAGFNSKTTFNRIFKEMTGKSPTEYKNHLKKERPNHDLGHHTRFELLILNREPLPKWAPEKINSHYMFKNYFKTAFRNFGKNKVFSFINVSGLAIGISASLVIYMIVSHEFGFDRFEKDGDRIYRVVSDMQFPNHPFKISGAPPPMARAIQTDVSGVKDVAQFLLYSPQVSITVPGKPKPDLFKRQDKIVFADGNFFTLFDRTWLAGSPTNLQLPFKVVLTESRAKQYFGNIDAQQAMGKIITYDDSLHATVTGIIRDLAENSDEDYKEFISLTTIPNGGDGLKHNFSWDSWMGINSASQLFVKLHKNANATQIQKQIQALSVKYTPKSNVPIVHNLQPLAAIHFDAEYDNFTNRQSQKNVMYGLLLVAAFLLLLGCINFINLTTAQATHRAKEIGIRKTMGSTKKQLIWQFLTETFVLTLAAAIISIIITPWLLKVFTDYIPTGVTFKMIAAPQVLMFMAVLVIVVSLVSGLYPAFVLSQYKPVDVLKSRVVSTTTGASRKVILRKSLTVAQFIIAQFFIIATIVVGKQIHYALNTNLGYKKEAILYLQTPNENKSRRLVLLNKIKNIPGVQTAALSGNLPASFGISFGTMTYNNGKKNVDVTADMKQGDSAFFSLYGLKLLAGTYIQPSDSTTACVINEMYVQALGFNNPQQIIGKTLRRGDKTALVIKGVLADFHTESLHAQIRPLIFTAVTENYFFLHVALKPRGNDSEAWKTSISKIQAAWKDVYPADDFSYDFFDATIAQFYTEEQSVSTLLTWATGLTIFISCLGLLGLAIYTTNQRTKEIGVRKVLGASIQQIVLLLSKDFVQLIILAFVIAVPLAWVAMHKWLQDYAYRTTLNWWVFAISGLLLIAVALIVLSVRTVRAASANPVKSLRSE